MERLNFATVKEIQLVCVGQGFNREYQGHYNRYKVLVDGVPIEDILNEKTLKDLPYWVNRSKVMAMTVWGMSQEFKAKYTLSGFLGWNFLQREQNKMHEKIKAIY